MSAAAPPAPTPTAERRTAARFRPALGTVCRLGPDRPAGLVWDLSGTGVSMLVAGPPAAGAEVAAELASEGGAAMAVDLRVVHVRPVPTGDFLLGARFARPLGEDALRPFLAPPPARRKDG